MFDPSGRRPDNRVAYGTNGAYDTVEQAHYKALAQDPAFAAATAATSAFDAQNAPSGPRMNPSPLVSGG